MSTTTTTQPQEAAMFASINLIFTIYRLDGSGRSPFGVYDADSTTATVAEFVRVLGSEGAVVVRDNRTSRPWNHFVAGIGGGHDDAAFAETGRSHSVWLENEAGSSLGFGENVIAGVREMERAARVR